MNQRPQPAGKTVLPLFTARKRPRQAVIAHPKDKSLSTTGAEPNTMKNFRDVVVEENHAPYQRISPRHPYQPEGYRHMCTDGYAGAGKEYAPDERLRLGNDMSQIHGNGIPRDSHSSSQSGHPAQHHSGYYQTRNHPPQGISRAMGGQQIHLGPNSSYGSPPVQVSSSYGPPATANSHFRQQDYPAQFRRGVAMSGSSHCAGRSPINQSPATPRLVLPKTRSSLRVPTPRTPQKPHSSGPSPKKVSVSPSTPRKDSSSSIVSKNRLLSASIGGMKHWSQYRHLAPLVFEVYGFVQGNVDNGLDGVSKLFKLRDKQGSSIRCQYWEMEAPLPSLTPGKPYRCIGTLDQSTDIFKCMKIRQATPMEFDIQLKRVTISDQSMKACLMSEKEL